MRLWIVAAHPDDESIGASLALGGACEVLVIHVTAGAPRDARWWPEGTIDREVYARARAREADQALAESGARRLALAFEDQETVFALDELTRELTKLVAHGRPDAIITHAYEGGHPDHDAVAVACARARARAGSQASLLEMALYHGETGALHTGEFISGDESGVRCRLDAAQLQRRRVMLAAYHSQRSVLAPFFALGHECFRVAPTCDFTRPPHGGKLHYERLGMRPSADEWRELVARTAG